MKQGENQQQSQPNIWHRAGIVGMVGDERSHQYAIPAPRYGYWFGRLKEAPRFSQNKVRGRNSRAVGEFMIFFSSVLQSFTSHSTTKGEKKGVKK